MTIPPSDSHGLRGGSPASPGDPPPRIALRASLLGLFFVLGLGVIAGLAGFAIQAGTDASGVAEVVFLLAQAVAMVAAAVVAILSVRRRPLEYVPLRVPERRAWLGAVLLGAGVTTLSLTLSVRLLEAVDPGYARMLEEMAVRIETLASPLGLWLLVGAIAPLSEEVLFRGVVLRSLLDRWRMWPAVLVSSAVFALFHVHPIHMLIALPLGIAAGWAMARTGSLWPAVAVHAAANTLAVGGHWLAPELDAAPWWAVAPAIVVLALGATLLGPAKPEPAAPYGSRAAGDQGREGLAE